MVFNLSIELGNEAMDCAEDVADALRRCALRLTERDMEDKDVRPIKDLNGNIVGSYGFQGNR